LRRLKHHSILSRPHLKNAGRYLNSETKLQYCDYCLMLWPSLVKLGLRTLRKLCQFWPTP